MVGVPKRSVMSVLTNGLDDQLPASASARLGTGIYAAESSAACDQYSETNGDAHFNAGDSLHERLWPGGQGQFKHGFQELVDDDELHYMFVCRVALGHAVGDQAWKAAGRGAHS